MNEVKNPNLSILEIAVTQLDPLLKDLVFVGGSATGLLVSDTAASPVRATKDIDAIVQVASLVDYQRLFSILRQCGFREDDSETALICRWVSDFVLLDLMPTNKNILGFGNSWYEQAIVNANKHVLPSGKTIRMISSPYFLLTKLEAFEGRGKGDFQMSHDIEDIVVVLDGRPELVEEIADCDEKLRKEIAQRFLSLLNNVKFTQSIYGHVPPDAVSQRRVVKILETIKQISQL